MYQSLLKHRKRAMAYLSKHVEYNAFIHALAGIGFGIIIASPLAFPHPLRWALAFLCLSLLGHAYGMFAKK